METTNNERNIDYGIPEEDLMNLPFFNPDLLFTEERIEQEARKHLQKLNDEKDATMLYDPATKKTSSYRECKRSYGETMADKMYDAKIKNGGRMEKADYAEIMRIHDGKTSPSKPSLPSNPPSKAESKATKKANANPFIMLDHHLMRSKRVRKALRKSMALYLYLRTYIVRKKYDGDKLGLYEAYFKKGKLAACISIRTLARDWFMDEKTVSTYLTELVAVGIIRCETIPAEKAFDNQAHKVYILGTHEGPGREKYYVEELANHSG